MVATWRESASTWIILTSWVLPLCGLLRFWRTTVQVTANLQKYPQAFAYYKSLIQLRKNHPAFRLSTGDKVRQHLEFLPAQETCLVGFQLKNLEGIDAWKNIIVIYNFNKEAKKMQIPEGGYTVACCNGIINEEGLGFVSGKEAEIAPQSALILYQK